MYIQAAYFVVTTFAVIFLIPLITVTVLLSCFFTVLHWLILCKYFAQFRLWFFFFGNYPEYLFFKLTVILVCLWMKTYFLASHMLGQKWTRDRKCDNVLPGQRSPMLRGTVINPIETKAQTALFKDPVRTAQ